MKKCIVVILAVFFTSSVGFASPKSPILIVEKEKDQVKMMWNFSKLPENITGFKIQKKRLSDKRWKNAGKREIRFGMHRKNIANAEISDPLKEKLQNKYTKLIIKDNRLTSKNINDYINKHPKEKSFLLWALCMDFETSLISGLGFVDAYENTADIWEYRVIPIIENKTHMEMASNPVMVSKNDDLAKNLDLQAAFVKYEDKINIHVMASKSAFEQKHIKGYITYQQKDDGTKIPVNHFLSIPKKNNRGYSAVTSAKNANPDEIHTFIIQPITIFDTHCEPVLVNYRPN